MDTTANILIVEDDVIVGKILRRTLERRHYHICAIATTGEEAVRCAETTCPDLVLLDVNLPGKINGIEVARRITAQQTTRFIFFTGFSADQVKSRIDFLDRAVCLMKPVKNADLIEAIRASLSECAPLRPDNPSRSVS